jgi:hypothetical protein
MSNPLVKIVDTVYIVFFIVLYLYKLENLACYFIKSVDFSGFFIKNGKVLQYTITIYL